MTEPLLTIAETVQVSGLSESSIKHRLRAGVFINARKGPGPRDPWLIPANDLAAAGLLDGTSSFVQQVVTEGSPGEGDSVTAFEGRAELERLRVERAEALAEAARWRALAEERAERVEDLRLALRMLGPGPDQTSPPAAAASVEAHPGEVPGDATRPRRRWWRRGRVERAE